LSKPDNILHLIRVVGQIDGHDFCAGRWRQGAGDLRKYLHGLEDDEARAVITEEGWEARVVRTQLTEPRVIPSGRNRSKCRTTKCA